MNKVPEKQTYNQELTELTDKFLSIPTPKKKGNRKKADLADPERVARELRSYILTCRRTAYIRIAFIARMEIVDGRKQEMRNRFRS